MTKEQKHKMVAGVVVVLFWAMGAFLFFVVNPDFFDHWF